MLCHNVLAAQWCYHVSLACCVIMCELFEAAHQGAVLPGAGGSLFVPGDEALHVLEAGMLPQLLLEHHEVLWCTVTCTHTHTHTAQRWPIMSTFEDRGTTVGGTDQLQYITYLLNFINDYYTALLSAVKRSHPWAF